MEMQVLHGLTCLIAAVVDDAVILAAKVCADLGDSGEAVSHHRSVGLVDLAGAADVLLRHHKEVDGSLRLDVIEGVAEIVLIDLLAGDVTIDDGAEQTIVTHRSYLLSFLGNSLHSLADEGLHSSQSLIDLGLIATAAHGAVGLAAALTAHDGGDGLDDVAGLDATGHSILTADSQ